MPIRSIAVAGGGIVGLSAALAFARALPQARVQVVDTPINPNALADRLPGTLPQTRHFHRLVGIEEPALVRQAGATFRLGTRFEDWRAGGKPWLHCFGRYGAPVDNSSFQHQWVRLRLEGGALEYSAYSPGAAIARAGKFVHPADDPGVLLGSFDYALRLDPVGYHNLLRERASAARVSIRAGNIADVEVEGGRVAALRLGDRREIRADLFIDCAGPDASILGCVSDRFESWSDVLPLQQVVLRRLTNSFAGPVDVATATPTGYQLDIPFLSGGFRIGASLPGTETNEEGDRITIGTGRRPESWVGNVLAFGDAAVVTDPLQSTNLYLAQNAIRRAVSLIPDADFHPLVLAEFNRRTSAEADRVRDFIAVHYLGSSRRDGRFWSGLPDRRPSASLAHTLDQFLSRARLPKYEEETFDDDSWLAVLFGLGLQPRRIDPTALRVDASRARAMLNQIVSANAALPERLPLYADYVRRLISG